MISARCSARRKRGSSKQPHGDGGVVVREPRLIFCAAQIIESTIHKSMHHVMHHVTSMLEPLVGKDKQYKGHRLLLASVSNSAKDEPKAVLPSSNRLKESSRKLDSLEISADGAKKDHSKEERILISEVRF